MVKSWSWSIKLQTLSQMRRFELQSSLWIHFFPSTLALGLTSNCILWKFHRLLDKQSLSLSLYIFEQHYKIWFPITALEATCKNSPFKILHVLGKYWCIYSLCMWLCISHIGEVILSLRQRGMAAAAGLAGRQWWGHSAGRIKAVTTGAVVSASADQGSCAPGSGGHCYFFISLVLSGGMVKLARPTAWTHSCCGALETLSQSLTLGQRLWSHTVTTVLGGDNRSGYVETHLLTQLCKPVTALMWSDNSWISERTDAIRPQQSFVATQLQLMKDGKNGPVNVCERVHF